MSINIIGNTAFSLGIFLTLDLTNISNTRIQDIEKIDITGSGNNTLMLLALMVMVSLPEPALRTSIPPLPISVSLP
jgi:hypothetical protein